MSLRLIWSYLEKHFGTFSLLSGEQCDLIWKWRLEITFTFHYIVFAMLSKAFLTTIHTTLLDSSPAVYIILYTVQYIPFHIQDSPLYTYKDCLPFVCVANTSMNNTCLLRSQNKPNSHQTFTESVLTYSLPLNIGATYWEAIFACKFHYHQHLYHTTWHVFNRWRLLHLRTVRLLL